MENVKIYIKIIKKLSGKVIGYKSDTFWSLDSREESKEHTLNNGKIKEELISNLGFTLQRHLENANITSNKLVFDNLLNRYDQSLVCYELENGETHPQFLIEYNVLNKRFIFHEYTRQNLIHDKLIEILK